MFGHNPSKPVCPIEPETRAWIDARWSWLIEQFGSSRLRATRVVLPTEEFFPNALPKNFDDVRAILEQVCRYMELEPATIELNLYSDPYSISKTAGLYREENEKFHIFLEAGLVNDPLGLVAVMAHELGHVHLLGHRRIPPDTEDQEPLTDLLTVFLGMGVCTANAVIREHYWTEGQVSGWQMARRGYLTMPMYGYALALFAQTRNEQNPGWVCNLRADVGAAFEAASRFLKENPQKPSKVVPVAPLSSRLAEDTAEELLDEEGDDKPDISASELLRRYADGERNFRRARLSGLDLRGANLREADFSGADLAQSDLTGAVLTGANLTRADLQETILCDAALHGVNLCEVDFNRADLTNADLSRSDLRGTSFADAILNGTNLTGTVRNRRTDFFRVDLTKVVCDVDLLQAGVMEQINTAVGKWSAILAYTFSSAAVGGILGAFVGEAIHFLVGGSQSTWCDPLTIAGAVLIGIPVFAKLIRL